MPQQQKHPEENHSLARVVAVLLLLLVVEVLLVGSAVAAVTTTTNNNTSRPAALPTVTTITITSTGVCSTSETAASSIASTSAALSSIPAQVCGSTKVRKLPGSKVSTNVLDVLQSKCLNNFFKKIQNIWCSVKNADQLGAYPSTLTLNHTRIF